MTKESSHPRSFFEPDAGELQLTFGGLTTHVPHAINKIVDLSKVPVPAKRDGLLGAEFLEQHVVRIDPAAHTIAFYDPSTFAYRGKGKLLPLEFTNSRLYEDSIDDDLGALSFAWPIHSPRPFASDPSVLAGS